MQILAGRMIFTASDLNNFLECAHLSKLDWERVFEERPVDERSEQTELVARKGQEYEAAYLASLQRRGTQIVTIANAFGSGELERAAAGTKAAMRAGAPVILVASPALFDVRCNDVARMHTANALCRCVEKAAQASTANLTLCR